MKTTFFTLVTALLGDFNFNELRKAHYFLGMVYFYTFVFIGVFVTFNILIAIITDAYVETTEAIKTDEGQIQLGSEIVKYVEL
jgi:hypothetical protein